MPPLGVRASWPAAAPVPSLTATGAAAAVSVRLHREIADPADGRAGTGPGIDGSLLAMTVRVCPSAEKASA